MYACLDNPNGGGKNWMQYDSIRSILTLELSKFVKQKFIRVIVTKSPNVQILGSNSL